jgi:hypothetical protein
MGHSELWYGGVDWIELTYGSITSGVSVNAVAIICSVKVG